MKLSIITVNLNNKQGLIETFNSLASQTFQAFEHIVVDGLSDDGSQDVINSNKRVNKVICEKDSGVYDAMNKGIEIANGEYLLFLNSGDVLFESATLTTAIDFLQDYAIVYGDLMFADKANPHIFNYPDKLSFDFLHKASLAHPATFIKKNLFERYGSYDTSFKIAADWVFFMKTIVKENVTTKHISQVISKFDTGGLSSRPENMPAIISDRNRYLQKEFPLFLDDYQQYYESTLQLNRIKSAKGFRWLKALGVKKFQ